MQTFTNMVYVYQYDMVSYENLKWICPRINFLSRHARNFQFSILVDLPLLHSLVKLEPKFREEEL